MPRRYYDYPANYQTLNMISTIGSWILAAGLIIMFVNLIRSISRGERAVSNPWDGTTLEWQTTSPPPLENFEEIPTVTGGPYKRKKE